MNYYEITVSKSAAKELFKLPKKVNNKLIKTITALSEESTVGAKKLRGGSDNWRIRVGDYRVVYSVDDEILVVDVRKVGHRKDFTIDQPRITKERLGLESSKILNSV